MNVIHADVVIANGQSLSNIVDLSERVGCAIHMPAAWDAANLTLQAAQDPAGTFQNVHDDAGTEVTVTAAAGRVIALAPDKTRGLRYIKIRSGTSALPVNQTATRTLKLALVDDIRS